jgi:hypothetical protein
MLTQPSGEISLVNDDRGQHVFLEYLGYPTISSHDSLV